MKRRGSWKAFYPLFEAFDTFFYTPGSVTRTASHIRDGLDLKRMMTIVVIALIPCMFMAMWNTGYQAHLAMKELGLTAADGWRGAIMTGLGLSYSPDAFISCVIHGALYFLPVYIVTLMAGGVWEVLFAIVRKHEVNEGFLVTSALFPLILPPDIPLWQVALGISFGVVIGKEIFGGTGRNFMNPALMARAFLYFAHAPAYVRGSRLGGRRRLQWRHVVGAAGLRSAAPDALGKSECQLDAGVSGHDFRFHGRDVDLGLPVGSGVTDRCWGRLVADHGRCAGGRHGPVRHLLGRGQREQRAC